MNDSPVIPSTPAQVQMSVPDDHAFRILVEGVRDYAIFMLSPTGHIVSWNRGAQDIKGYRPEEIIGKHFSVFYPAEELEKGWPEYELKQAVADGHFEDEGWRIRSDGSRFWASVIITPLYDESGELMGYSKVTRDLTRRREHEERLRQSDERMRILIECVREYAIFMIDPVGKVMSWNLGAERIKGYAASEILGQSFTRFYTKEDLATGKPRKMLDLARTTGMAIDEGWRVRKDGTRFLANVVLTAMRDSNGVLIGFAKVTRDLTQTKRIETLETEGRRVNEFLAMLAHELRNPLAPIRNAVNVMGMADVYPEQLVWCRTLLDRQTDHLTRLVDDLLDVSRITSGKIKLNKDTVDFATLIARGVEASAPQIQTRGHELQVDIGAETMLVHGDALRLIQVLSNLLNNAAKYTPPGGRITLSARTEGGNAVLRVRDTGIGIPAHLIHKIFDVFQQGDRGLDRQEGGLGIGLALVDSIVKLHDGKVEAFSEGDGKGSEFVVTLPLTQPVAQGEPTKGESPSGSQGGASAQPLRVLIIDDNRDSAASMASLVEILGHRAKTLFDGTSAVEEMREFRPDLVLLDIGLPGMSGYEVAQHIRRCADLDRVKLSAMTGYGQAEDRMRAEAVGFDEFLVKPVEFEELNGLLERVTAEVALASAG
jgi:PAS domain S-box-containing protein